MFVYSKSEKNCPWWRQNGDKFVDKIQGKEHTYQDGQLILAGEKK